MLTLSPPENTYTTFNVDTYRLIRILYIPGFRALAVFRKQPGVCTCIREHSIGLVFATYASVNSDFCELTSSLSCTPPDLCFTACDTYTRAHRTNMLLSPLTATNVKVFGKVTVRDGFYTPRKLELEVGSRLRALPVKILNHLPDKSWAFSSYLKVTFKNVVQGNAFANPQFFKTSLLISSNSSFNYTLVETIAVHKT